MPSRPWSLLSTLAACCGCSLVTPFAVGPVPDARPPADADADADVDAGQADGDAHVDADQADGDAQDGDAAEGGACPSGLGPLTFVAAEGTLSRDRPFDLDGDGVLDNSVDDLGGTDADRWALLLWSILNVSTYDGSVFMVHMPRVHDRLSRTDPEGIMVMTYGLDTDSPLDPHDDLSGAEPFWVRADSIDACGEPLSYFDTLSLDDGGVEARGGTMRLPTNEAIIGRRMQAQGTIAEDCGSVAIVVAGALCIPDLGAFIGSPATGDLTMLELFLTGGGPLGVAAMPGLDPDLDLDGDGLEGFLIDGEGRLTHCVDGDMSVLEGRDCWQDESMADAFSFVLRYNMVSATLVGLEPDWQGAFTEPCEDPPAESLFDFHEE